MEPPVNPGNKKILVVLIFAGIVLVGLILYAGMTYFSNPGQGKSSGSAAAVAVNPVTTQPLDYVATRSTTTAAPTLTSTTVPVFTPTKTMVPQQNPASSSVISQTPATMALPVTTTYGDSSGSVAQQPFTLSVSPASASGKPGETISYTLRINGGEGQAEPVHFTRPARSDCPGPGLEKRGPDEHGRSDRACPAGNSLIRKQKNMPEGGLIANSYRKVPKNTLNKRPETR